MLGLGRGLKWFAITIGVVAFSLLLINLFDESLLPEAAAFGDFSSEQVTQEDNAYFAVIGFYARRDADPHQRGVEVVKTINARVQSNEAINVEELQISHLLGADRIDFKGDGWPFCKGEAERCLPVYFDKRHEINRAVTENQILLSRYSRLYRYAHFKETIRDTLISIYPNYANSAYYTVLAKTGLQAAQGQVRQALIALEQDTGFWRRVLRDSRQLVSNMVALARVKRNMELLSEIIATQQLDATAQAAAERVLAPLTLEERNLRDAMRTEYVVSTDLLKSPFTRYRQYIPEEDRPAWDNILSTTISALFYQRNATINMTYRQYRKLAELAGLPAQEFVPRLRQLQTQDEARLAAPYRWDYLYNPAGKVLFAMGASSSVIYGRYMGDAHNLDGLMRLVAVQLTIKQQRIADHAVMGFLERLDDSYRDPYTGAPLRWDPETRALYFEGMPPRGTGDALVGERIEVYL